MLFSGDAIINQLLIECNKQIILAQLTQYDETDDYAGAIAYLEANIDALNGDVEVTQKLELYKDKYRDIIIIEAEEAFNTDGYEAALFVLEECQNILGNDSEN